MSLSDELAYTSATELARPHPPSASCRRSRWSTRRSSGSRSATPSLNAVVYHGFDDARRAAQRPSSALMSGARSGRSTACRQRSRISSTSSPAGPRRSAACRRCADLVIDAYCIFAERVEQAGADHRRQDQQPCHGHARHLRQPALRPVAQSVRHDEEHRWLVGRQRRLPSPTGSCRSPRAPTAAVRSASRRRGAACTASSRRAAACRCRCGRTRSVAPRPFVAEGPITRTVDDAALALPYSPGYDSRDPFALADKLDLTGGVGRSIRGDTHRLQPGLRCLSRSIPASPPRSQQRSERSRKPVRSSRRSSRPCAYDHLELADLWCRMIAPLNIGAIEGLQGRWHRPARRAPRRLAARVRATGSRRGYGHERH